MSVAVFAGFDKQAIELIKSISTMLHFDYQKQRNC